MSLCLAVKNKLCFVDYSLDQPIDNPILVAAYMHYNNVVIYWNTKVLIDSKKIKSKMMKVV